MTTETAASGEVGLGRGGRLSRQRKRDAVLRLLRGEDLDTLSRALGATARDPNRMIGSRADGLSWRFGAASIARLYN
jgi:hypothetical protein